ncbi:Oidioi.mRNA.OKI2018_I69.XSR.g14647.t1.cds [Oikopleura dioica]|nr:Oidioi.mRNA.OKI2018_I69.XSR.g14647.t1.cds [Oikopleura dioica]
MESFLPPSIIKGIEYYKDELGVKERRLKHTFDEIGVMRKKLQYLKDFTKLRIYAWNGEKYDLNVIYPMLASVLYEFVGQKSKDIYPIKRGGGYMMLDAAGLSFRDFMNLSGPMKLEKLANSCGLDSKEYSKGCFPYEWYTKVEHLYAAKNFPAYPCFYSTLESGAASKAETYATKMNEIIVERCAEIMPERRWNRDEGLIIQLVQYLGLDSLVTDPVLIEWCETNGDCTPKDIFKKHLSMLKRKFLYHAEKRCHQCDPKDAEIREFFRFDPVKYEESNLLWDEMEVAENHYCGAQSNMNMMLYLINYNYNDVKLLVGSIDRYAANYKRKFGLGVHADISIAKMAQKIAFIRYDKKCPPLYSPPAKADFYYNDCRQKLLGGICQVLHRAIYLNHKHDDPRIPNAAKFAPNGERYKTVVSLDFNSLYPWAVRRELPLGPGILYKMADKWDGRCRSDAYKFYNQGLFCQKQNSSLESIRWLEYLNWSEYDGRIEHSYNLREKKIAGHFVDGYAELPDTFVAPSIPKKVIFEFRGCTYHTCPVKECKVKPWLGVKKTMKDDEGKNIIVEISADELRKEDDARIHKIVDHLRAEYNDDLKMPQRWGERPGEILDEYGPLNFRHRIEIIYSCQWKKLWSRLELLNTPPISKSYPLIFKGAEQKHSGCKMFEAGVTEEDFLKTLRETYQSDENPKDILKSRSKFFGIALVDLESPPQVIVENPHVPPIFAKMKLESDMLHGYMKRVLPSKMVEQLYPSEENIFCYNTKRYLATSEMLAYLDRKGLKIRVHYFIEYYRGSPFENFVATMVKDRVAAKVANNDTMQLVIKLILNAMVGRFALAVSRFMATKIVGADKMYDAIRSPLLHSTKPLRVEDIALDPLHEIVSKKKRVTEDLAIHVQIFVYQE